MRKREDELLLNNRNKVASNNKTLFISGFKATQSFKACNSHNDLLQSLNKTEGYLTCNIKTEIEKVREKLCAAYYGRSFHSVKIN